MSRSERAAGAQDAGRDGRGAAGRKPRPRRILRTANSGDPDANSISRADDAYAYIRDRILSLEMAPGSVFSEAGIAKALHASKTPIREALVRLEHEGLVTSAPRSGYQVSPITLKDTRELGELRGMLLVEAAGRTAARGLSAEEEAQLEQLIDATDAAVRNPGPDAMPTIERLHREFDLAVARAAGNDWLTRTLTLIFDELRRVRVLAAQLSTKLDQVHESQQRAIFEAIRNRDAEAARAAMRERVEEGQRRTLMGLLESPALLSANLGAGFGDSPK